MPATMKPFSSARRPVRRSVRVTGRKYAVGSSSAVQQVFGRESHDRVRPFVAALGSEVNSGQLFDLTSVFLQSPEDLAGLPLVAAQLDRLLDRLRETVRNRGIAQVARPLPIQRLRSPEHHGYPLRRTQLVVFNREKGRVTAELREVSRSLDLRGIGADEALALRDLERQFDWLVREKVRIPLHARQARDEMVRLIVDHLVDWEQFERENPTPRLLWGRITRHGHSLRPTVHWLRGPGGLQEQTGPLPWRLRTSYFLLLKEGDWFRAVVLEYPDRIEWLEPPTRCPDPTDPATRQAAWDSIPRLVADRPDVWPLKGS